MRATGLINDAPGTDRITYKGIEYRKGDKVRLRLGQRRSDASDFMLDRKVATIENIYIDYEDKIHLAVTVDDDPGQDMRRELGYYLYFSPEEVEYTAFDIK
jgi:hypothetical protein